MRPTWLYDNTAQLGRVDFGKTQWTTIRQAGESASTEAFVALEKICDTYWYPIYVFVRKRGHPAHEAQDLTQEFFLRMVEKNYLRHADPMRGRFRTFLLAALKHFLLDENKRAKRLKRGGGAAMFVPLEGDDCEVRFQAEPKSDLSPDKLYERQWAAAVLDHATRQLQAENCENSKARRFECLHRFLLQDPRGGDYPAAARELGMSDGAVATTVHRLRQRFGELVRAQIAPTISDPFELEAEVQHLVNLTCETQ